MKLFYKLLFLTFAHQLIQAKSLKDSADASSNTSILTPKKQLMRFYRAEFNHLTGEVCAKLEVVTARILNDDQVQHPDTVLLEQLRRNLTHFQNISPYYVRFGLNESLATVFSQMLLDFYVSKPFYLKEDVVVKQLLTDSGYDDIREQYKTKFKNFFLKKFKKKFEQLKEQISNGPQLEKFENRFSKCIGKAKECEDYECLLTNFRTNTLYLKDKFMGNVQRQMLDMSILVLQDYSSFYKKVLKHPKFQRLDATVKAEILKTFQRFEANFEDIDNFYVMFHIGGTDNMLDFIDNLRSAISPKQKDLLTKIFEDCGQTEPLENYKNNFAAFLQKGFINEIEDFKASFEQEASPEDAPLMEVLESLDRSSSLRERALLLMSLNVSETAALKKWRL